MRQTTDRISKLMTDKHFLFLYYSYFYIVHLNLIPFILEIAKIVEILVYKKSKSKSTVIHFMGLSVVQ